MSFLQDYVLYHDGNECPRKFVLWSGLVVLSIAAGRKVYIEQDYFTIYPNIYVCLVGSPGSRKTSSKDIARDLVTDELPAFTLAASTMTKEAITKFLGDEESLRVYKDETAALVEWRPFGMFINELKNFLNVNPRGMIDFLTDIYDRKFFDVGTKNKGSDIIKNPYFVMLACETPEWLMSNLRMDVISGGWARRVIHVYDKRIKRIAFPFISPEAKEAWKRVRQHLHDMQNIAGPLQWGPGTREWYNNWYTTLKMPEDATLNGFYETLHIQLLKTAILWALNEYPPSTVLQVNHLQLALDSLDAVADGLPRLTQGIGRNDLAEPTVRLLEVLDMSGGKILLKQLKLVTWKDMRGMEFEGVLAHLEQTDQIRRVMIKNAAGHEQIYVVNMKYIRAEAQRKQQESTGTSTTDVAPT